MVEKRCRNPRCTCPVGSESDYCSAQCASANLGVGAPAECACEHEACQAGGHPEATDPAPRR